jgi:peptidoglycan-associated lipoprotein
MKKVLVSIVLVNLLAACASEKPNEMTSAAPVSTKSSASNFASTTGSSTSATAGSINSITASGTASSVRTAADSLNDSNSILAKRSVYYPVDVSIVQDADKPVILAHAKYLSEHANRKMRLEGNCDERGSTEYNLALGQHRADGVKELLVLSGARSSQLMTFSYGEEKPMATGHDEADWMQNRRTDLKFTQ